MFVCYFYYSTCLGLYRECNTFEQINSLSLVVVVVVGKHHFSNNFTLLPRERERATNRCKRYLKYEYLRKDYCYNMNKPLLTGREIVKSCHHNVNLTNGRGVPID